MGITFYDIQASLRYLYPKPLDVNVVLGLLRRGAYELDGEPVPNMRLVDLRTLEEVTGHILEADEPHIVCCEGGDDLPLLLEQLRSVINE
jgi:hypothetical protein